MATTTYNKPKSFAWSYSKLKNYDTCPKRYYEVDVTKNFKENESEALKWGNAVHAALHQRLLPGKVSLPEGMQQYEPWAKKVEDVTGELFVEQQYALNEMLQPVTWFAKNAWVRSIADAVKIDGSKALAVDWKLGKIVEDSQQLALMAACIFSHYPDVQSVDTLFVWFKEDAKTHEKFLRADIPKIWLSIMPRVKQLKHAHDTNAFPTKPSKLCRAYCPVVTCEYHGR